MLGGVAAVLCCVLLLMLARGVLGGVASLLLAPVAAAKAWVAGSSSDLALHLRTQEALIGEVRTLEDTLEARSADTLALEALRAENDALHRALGVVAEQNIAGFVLTGPWETPYDTLLVDKGSRDGIVEGATVYAAEHVAIGAIVAVYPESALVLLASAPGVESTVYVRGADAFATATGQGGGGLRVALPQGVPLAPGDLVLLPAVGGVYGTVASVEAPPESPYQYGYVASPVALSSLRLVFIAPEAPATLTPEEARRAVDAATSTLFSIPGVRTAPAR